MQGCLRKEEGAAIPIRRLDFVRLDGQNDLRPSNENVIGTHRVVNYSCKYTVQKYSLDPQTKLHRSRSTLFIQSHKAVQSRK